MNRKNELQEALRLEEFVLYLQPKYSLEENHLSGAEVLVRWQHQELGLLGPEYFLNDVQEEKLSWDLDCYIWRQACEMMSDWVVKGWKIGPLTINLSNQTLFHKDVVLVLENMLQEYNLTPDMICIEVKEDIVTENLKEAKEIITKLQKRGFILILDNFGRSVSSIKSLNEMKFDRLKVDMNFLSQGGDTEKSELILSAIIKMANWLGMSVTAECVETQMQKDFSEASGCETIQGFYFNKPMSRFEYEEAYMLQLEKELLHTESRETKRPMQDLSILVIDDSEMERSLLRRYLEDEYYIYDCASAESGLAYLKRNKKNVHLILIDYIMPGMSGMDFLRICNEDEELKMIPKIMITAKGNPEDQIEAFRAGAYDYLTKPLIPEIVRARIFHSMEVNNRLKESVYVGENYRHQAEIDKATGLLNKSTFQTETMGGLSRNLIGKQALFVIDIDDFKRINDEYGHLKGDEVIQLIARELKAHFRATDYVGRFGGDEFVVCMTGVPKEELVTQKAEELQKEISQQCMENLQLSVSVSVGVSYYKELETFEHLFERADKALYQAKKEGKSRTVVIE